MKTFTVETAAIGVGKIVKKGTAEKGAVIGTANCDALGIVVANDFAESFAVGEDISVAHTGELAIVIAGTTITAGDSLQCNSAGLASVMQIVNGSLSSVAGQTISHAFRVARALENGLPNEGIEVVVTNDIVTTIVDA
jgi:hypothetical protein